MLVPRKKTPDLKLNLINGKEWVLSEQTPDLFTLIIVYRGLHCPVCKKYLEELQRRLSDFEELGVNVIAISSDSKEKAVKTYNDWDIDDIALGYEFSIEEARKWGLYVSSGIKNEPNYFIEPGLFLIRPNQELYCTAIQSMPFARPGISAILKAIEFVKENDYPARGEA